MRSTGIGWCDVSRTRSGATFRVFAGRWRSIDRASLKQKAREKRRRIDAAIVLRALAGDEDVPKTTRNVECEDRWCHD